MFFKTWLFCSSDSYKNKKRSSRDRVNNTFGREGPLDDELIVRTKILNER